MPIPNTTQAVNETKQRKDALRCIIEDFAPFCMSCSVEYAEFCGKRSLFYQLRKRAKEAGLIFDYYENSRGFHICLTTRDLSDYSY